MAVPNRLGEHLCNANALLVVLGAARLFAAQQIVTTTYGVPTANSEPEGIIIGPDNNVWFTENRGGGKIGRLVPATGVVTEFTLPDGRGACPWDIIDGPDGALWYSDTTNSYIGRITTDGVVTNLYPTLTPNSGPRRITVGPDGALWFTEYLSAQIGRLTLDGEMTEYPVPTPHSEPSGITTGPDGAIWFNENTGNQIVRMTTGGIFTNAYPLPTPNSVLGQIHPGADGNLWVTENDSDKIGRLNPNTGELTEWIMPTPGSVPGGLTAAPDGAMWFTEWANAASQIGRITPDGVITEFPDGTPGSEPWGIAASPDGTALWYANWEIAGIATAPICALGMTASYSASSGMLDLGFSIGTSEPWTWTTTVTQSGVLLQQLWSELLPAQLPLVVQNQLVPFASTGGDVTVVSGLFDSTEAMVCQESDPVNTGVAVSTATVLTSSPNPSNAGQSVTFTATVLPAAATGTVTFTIGSVRIGKGTVANGVATLSSAALPAGSHKIVATYQGNVDYLSSVSKALTQTVE